MGEAISEEIPLTPVGREAIHRLEYALLIGTLFRPEVMEKLRDPTERLTWIDSLAVAAAALAREKAKMTVPQIAEELGRTEATIRNHLTKKTKAGELVAETYEKLAREGARLELPWVEEVRKEAEARKALEEKLQKVKEELSKLLSEL